jgi:hypothetical protein
MWQGIGSLAGSMTNWQSIFGGNKAPNYTDLVGNAQALNKAR